MSARPITSAPMLSVYDGPTCVGFILRRRQSSAEAFTADEHSIGLFKNEHDAAAALWRLARGQGDHP